MRHESLWRPERWIVVGIPLLFIAGSIMHFLYNLLLESPIVGLLAPVNESIWEHSKMVLWPMILWWLLYYVFRKNRYRIDKNKWFTGALTALLVSLAAMPLLYYFYTGAFGVELLWVDILILLLAVALGQLLGLHVYRYGRGIQASYILVVLVLVILLFMLFTYCPPHIPLSQDGMTGGYGLMPRA